ncbi:SRPBCC family protein [Streptomyces orinoci]|uniref:SRPBCC family protein n=1 Tax=Streptomyces orinoci TaxID=67339 RepID=A0ABV3K1C7_STRON|nr:SRPBCC family protein [Streptomyces orinoci]
MARQLRPVGVDFAGTARLRMTFTAVLAAGPEAVYRALAEDVTAWPQWFRAVTLARPAETAGRRGRVIGLAGGVRFAETIMAAEPSRRYTYRIDRTNVPAVRGMLEDWRLSPAGAGTALSWTVALDAPPPVRWLLRLARPAFRRAFRQAVGCLDVRLAGLSRSTGRS